MRLTVAVTDWQAIEDATAGLDPPFAALDVAALDANADDLVRRAAGVPVRLASKSIRCRWVLDRVLGRPGFAGVMAYSLPEALWLADNGHRDILVAYPSVDRGALRQLARSPGALAEVIIMVDSRDHLELLRRVLPSDAGQLQLCLDIDSSLRMGPFHLGVRRSPLRTADAARALAAEIAGDPAFRLVGLMFYDAQIAGMPDSTAAVRAVKRRSAAELLDRRAAIVEAVRTEADIRIVNAAGTGSLHVTGSDPCLTELAAGSGLYAPTLFDRYRDFSPHPAMFFALAVTRRPARRIVTGFGGGYIASGAAGESRLPQPAHPAGLRLLGAEGAGEVQTPVRGSAARRLSLGDRLWFRHAKAGEMLERFDTVHLVQPGKTEATATPSYRGEGKNFG